MHPMRPSGRLSRRFADVRGYTLVELLVCMLILAIMAAIALPAWLDQRAKGQDAEAKLTLKSAVTALATYETAEGDFNATRAQLEAIEPALAEARNLRVIGTADTYELKEDSAVGTEFTLSRDATGIVTRDCTNHGYALCRANLDANGNRW
jgi:type IV pilus assembly protein PilA